MDAASTVVFDLGEVLVPSTGVLAGLAAELGVDEPTLGPAYWAARRAYDLGGSSTRYWSGVAEAVGRAPDPDVLARLERLDSEKWSTLPAESAALLRGLVGVRLAVLSNAPAPLAAAVRAASWSTPFAHLIFSADVGVAKPDPAIYAHADRLLGGLPAVFFDDRPENVDAARAHGWDAHVWAGPHEARRIIGR
ncbi:HAD-IA family hydrolase [Pseudonocardia sp.]|uniref:HAD-IA family hydrolase n=1 Tax=Pseudonocardia sp. TaxID=60912 RepID=UPI002612AE1E|nr:HAD-IA family hydrolase [Pseudonocardia sp.]